jgi:hypothetical protein
MQTISHPSPQSAVGARARGGFEQTPGQASLRRVETKEFVFTEGDPTTHVFRVETGAVFCRKKLPLSHPVGYVLACAGKATS